MRIIVCEIKKIWSIKTLAIIAVLSALYFTLISGYLSSYPRGYPRGIWFWDVDFGHHLTENYGATLEQDDFDDFFESYFDIIYHEINSFIESRPIFFEAGIFDIWGYWDTRDFVWTHYDTLSEREINLWYAVYSEMESSLPNRRMQNFFDLINMYEHRWVADINYFIEHTPVSDREAQRLREIRDSGEMLSIMPSYTMFLTSTYGRYLSVLVILVTLILNSPIITTDRANRVNWLQYSSKQGRHILKKQFIAILISAIGMTTIILAVFSWIFSSTETYVFWNNGINSFLNFPYYWLPITYGQYVLLIVGIIYLLSIGTAAFAFVLSRLSHSMIRLIFKIIPFFIMTMLLSNWILDQFLAIYLGGDVLMQMLSILFLLIVGTTLATLVTRREKRVELE